MGAVWLAQMTRSAPKSFHIKYTATYLSLTLFLNIVVTSMIVFRLLQHRRKARKSLGSCHGTLYTSVATMVVESAALYSVFLLVFLIFFAIDHPLQFLFLQILGEIQVNDSLPFVAISTNRKSLYAGHCSIIDCLPRGAGQNLPL